MKRLREIKVWLVKTREENFEFQIRLVPWKERVMKYKIIKKFFIEGWEIFKEGSFTLRAKSFSNEKEGGTNRDFGEGPLRELLKRAW